MKLNKCIIKVLCFLMIAAALAGCKSKKDKGNENLKVGIVDGASVKKTSVNHDVFGLKLDYELPKLDGFGDWNTKISTTAMKDSVIATSENISGEKTVRINVQICCDNDLNTLEKSLKLYKNFSLSKYKAYYSGWKTDSDMPENMKYDRTLNIFTEDYYNAKVKVILHVTAVGEPLTDKEYDALLSLVAKSVKVSVNKDKNELFDEAGDFKSFYTGRAIRKNGNIAGQIVSMYWDMFQTPYICCDVTIDNKIYTIRENTSYATKKLYETIFSDEKGGFDVQAGDYSGRGKIYTSGNNLYGEYCFLMGGRYMDYLVICKGETKMDGEKERMNTLISGFVNCISVGEDPFLLTE